tara:strand:- start:1034 stop:1318 length:285 start_codon:yes stop_codon:yes gene_type:complete
VPVDDKELQALGEQLTQIMGNHGKIFHANSGLYFTRFNDGAIGVVYNRTVIVLHVNIWASIMSKMCIRGESKETLNEALDFHNKKNLLHKKQQD